MSVKSEQAAQCYQDGCNCAQAVLAVFAEKYGLEMKMAMRLACGLGGGCRCGEVCGTATGGLLVIGLKDGPDDAADQESKAVCYERAKAFMDSFRARHGTAVCRELVGYDVSIPQEREKAVQKDLFQTVCVPLIRDTVEQLEKLGY